MDFREVRRDLQDSDKPDVRRRRGIVVLSVVGMVAFVPIVLRQIGIIKNLPDPPIPSFDSNKINLSDSAFRLGVPDGTIGLAGYASNLPLAAIGGAERADEQPWWPLLATGKAGFEALVALWYFYQMPAKEKAWCGYCILGQLSSLGIFALSLPEGLRAWRSLRGH